MIAVCLMTVVSCSREDLLMMRMCLQEVQIMTLQSKGH